MTEFDALQAALRGRYLLGRELGRGGMGIVYLARDVALDRPVALKLLPSHLASDPALRARFLQEARTAARLSHPNIVPIHAVEEHGSIACFVMAYVPGETLAERVDRQGPLPPDRVGRMVQEIAWALAYAHERGVVHRDIKPENILLERGTGRALLTDFGIARVLGRGITPAGSRVEGTARSMSPEQAAGGELDGRSDLYSLGVTAFFALTGRFPFESDSPAALLRAHLALPAPPVASLRPGVPSALAGAIDRSLAKSPGDRFTSAAALAESLAASEAVAAPVPPSLARLSREISGMAQDLGGYLSLAGIAAATQLLLSGNDFLGFGYVYTVGIALVLVSLVSLRGIQVWRLLRDAAREGWNADDLERALQFEAAQASADPPPHRGRASVLFGAGVAALLAFWLGPKQWALESMQAPLGILVELASLFLPVALGRWYAGRLEAPHQGKPGLFSRLSLAKARWLFRLAGLVRGKRRPEVAEAPTEVLLADATRALFQALPPAERHPLGDVPAAIARLEKDAERLRLRLRELDRTAAEVGPGPGGRAELAEELGRERDTVAAQLSTAVSALETIRLDLLRLRAGLGARSGLTGSLEETRRIGAGVDAALEIERK